MGNFLSNLFFKNKDSEEQMLKAMVMKKLLEEVSDLNKRVRELELKQNSNNSIAAKVIENKPLPKMLKSVYDNHSKFIKKNKVNPTYEELSELTNKPVKNLRNAIKDIRNKGYKIEFSSK